MMQSITDDTDVCRSEDDIHDRMDELKINRIIDKLGINRYTFFKQTKKFSRDDIEDFNRILEVAFKEEPLYMFETLLILSKMFVDIDKAKKLLSANNLRIIKEELADKYRINQGPVNTLMDFFN